MPGAKWGRVEPETERWWKRYHKLKSEGFCHNEAAQLAVGVIGSKKMLAGRKRRREWFKTIKPLGLNDAEIEERIDEMYDVGDWMDPWSQFYAEEGDEEEVGAIG